MNYLTEVYSISNRFEKNDSVKSNLILGQEGNDDNPLVSILMPCYNHHNFLAEAIKSAITQDCDIDYEIVIVDNNHEIIQKLNENIVKESIGQNIKIRYYLNEKNIGPCGNWNRCIELAKGKYVTFLHDDDALLPDALRRLTEAINETNENQLIVGQNNVIDKDGDFILKIQKNITHKKFSLRNLLIDNCSNGGGTLYNRNCLLEIGGYNDNLHPCFDYALNVLYISRFGAKEIKSPIFNYRISGENDTKNCYDRIAEIDYYIWRAVQSKLDVPQFISDIVIKANTYIKSYADRKAWDKEFSPNLNERINWYLYLAIRELYRKVYL